MDREQKSITTTSGKIVVIKAYLNGKESNALKATLFKGMTSGGDATEKPKFPLENVIPYERAQLEALLVSVDGSTESPVDLLENLPSSEYDDAVKQIREAAGLSLAAAK